MFEFTFSITIYLNKFKLNNNTQYWIQLQQDISKEYNTEDEFMKAIENIKKCFKTTTINGFCPITRLKINTNVKTMRFNGFDNTDQTMIYIIINVPKDVHNGSLCRSLFQQKEVMESIYDYIGPCNKKWTERLINAREIYWNKNLLEAEEIKQISICPNLKKLTFENVKVDFNRMAIQFPNLEELCLDCHSIVEKNQIEQMIKQLSNFNKPLESLHLNLKKSQPQSVRNLMELSITCLEIDNLPSVQVDCLKITPVCRWHESMKGDIISGFLKLIKTEYLHINSAYLTSPFSTPETFEELKQTCEFFMTYKEVRTYSVISGDFYFGTEDEEWFHKNHKWLYLNRHFFDRQLLAKIVKREMFEEFCRGLNLKNPQEDSSLNFAFSNNVLFEKHTISTIFDFM